MIKIEKKLVEIEVRKKKIEDNRLVIIKYCKVNFCRFRMTK